MTMKELHGDGSINEPTYKPALEFCKGCDEPFDGNIPDELDKHGNCRDCRKKVCEDCAGDVRNETVGLNDNTNFGKCMQCGTRHDFQDGAWVAIRSAE